MIFIPHQNQTSNRHSGASRNPGGVPHNLKTIDPGFRRDDDVVFNF